MKATKKSPTRQHSKTNAPLKEHGKQKHRGKVQALEDLELIHLHAAGIDIGSAENMVCVPARSVRDTQSNVRSFGVFTQQQDDLVEWLYDWWRRIDAWVESKGDEPEPDA